MLGKLVQFASFYPGAFLTLWRMTRAGDVIVAKTDPPLISVVAMVVARARGAKLLNWIQDLYPEVAVELKAPLVAGPVGRILKHLRNMALQRAETNVVIGSKMRDRLVALGVRPQRIAVIPNWSDERHVRPIDPVESKARQNWGFSPSDFVVGYSGNLGRAHEIDTLVGAAKHLRGRPDIKFLFVGGGRQNARLQRLIARDGLTSFIFKPYQAREELADSLAAADVHWLSLRPELEGLIVPSKLYGILAAGRPVLAVCDESGEVANVVREQACGIVVSPGNAAGLAAAIARLADDSLCREEFGRRARRASEMIYPMASALRAWSLLVETALDKQPTEHMGANELGAVREH